jgi:phosphohistidine swiveling domain-containing protein
MTWIRQFREVGREEIEIAGGKGANLGELTRAGLPVPPGFVVTTDAYRAFVEAAGIGPAIMELASAGGAEAAERIRELFRSHPVPDELRQIVSAYQALGEEIPVSVRSSATAEDLAEASFAGQQDTYLNVRGTDQLLDAVRDCWASLWTERATAYRLRQGIDPASVSLAVVVQQMVDADAAGVMFTANPANGRRDEAVISAAWGLGEAVVSGAVNTDNLVIRKPDGPVLSRDTADKAVMTSYATTGTEERPVPTERRTEPVLDDRAATELAGIGAAIEAHYGAAQDVEWARTGDVFYVLQARPITALPEPEGPVPTDWTVPEPTAMYFRASIVEQLPDPLSPLFADLIDGSVTRSISTLFQEFLGENVIRDGDLGLPTINGYAYYGYDRAGMGRIMLRSPKAFKVLTRKDEYNALPRWRTYSHPRYQAVVDKWQARGVAELTSGELLDAVIELLDGGAEYYTSVQTIIPLAATSEIVFSRYYDSLIRRDGDPPALTFLLGFDSEPIRAEKSLYDLAGWARERSEFAALLVERSSEELVKLFRGDEPPEAVDKAVWNEWRSRFQAHLDRYGHAVYNLDFVNPVPADEPAPLLDTIRFYLRGEGQDPYERQRRTAARREEATAAVLKRLDPVRRAGFTRLLRWAQDIGPVREDALADVGLAWPLMRRMLLELGRRLVASGVIERPEDVFWLHHPEIRDWIADPQRVADGLTAEVKQRKEIWRGQRRATPPQILPKAHWLRLFSSMMPAASEEQTGAVIKGTGASAGQVTADARVLGGPGDFSQMQPGDALVASITTPAWTSLFAMASAVVTDIGGPLSHSSIVAREYGIPAVLGTAVATRRIHSGERIRVDGDAGTVTLLDQQQDGEAAASGGPVERAHGRRRIAAVVAGGSALGVTVWAVMRRRRRRRGCGLSGHRR